MRRGDTVKALLKTYLQEPLDLATCRLNLQEEALIWRLYIVMVHVVHSLWNCRRPEIAGGSMSELCLRGTNGIGLLLGVRSCGED